MDSPKIVSVITATYNRVHTIKDLYRSLNNQTDTRFQWIVIDDGSTDDTESFFNSIQASSYPIIYKKKENGGKHKAINYGMTSVNTPLVFIVDSDDTLTPDAIEIIISKYSQHTGEDDLCGYSFLRGTPDGGLLSSSQIPKDGIKDTFVNCRLKNNIAGDMAEVWVTDILKRYPFPEFDGEKFLGEDVIWIKMSEKYNMYFYNSIIYISEYLEDGLTKNRRMNNIRSPKGCTERAKTFLAANIGPKYNLKAMIQYIVYGKIAKYKPKQLLNNSPKKILYCLLFLPSIIVFLKWKKDYSF